MRLQHAPFFPRFLIAPDDWSQCLSAAISCTEPEKVETIAACSWPGKMTISHCVQVRAMLQQQQSFVMRLDDSNAPVSSVAPGVEQSKAGELLYGLLRVRRLA